MSNICEKVCSCFDYGEQIVVGVSGGADSMVLLHCLSGANKNFELTVAHLNHGLRGEESDGDERFVANWCKERGIRFVCKRLDIAQIAKEQHISIELSGRDERYKFFDEIGGRIATAHTLSDRVETMLFNMARGTGVRGLCSIPQTRGRLVRPLLSFTRAEIEKYCEENGVPYRHDSSNDSDDYTRNRIRHHVATELKSINPNFEKHVGRLLDGLVQDEEFLIKIAKEKLKKVTSEDGIKVKNISVLEYPIKVRVIDLFLKMNSILTTHEMLMRIIDLCSIGHGKQSLPDDKSAVIHRGILSVENKYTPEPFDIVMSTENSNCYKNFYFVKCDVGRYDYFLNNTEHLFLFKLDYGKILGNVHIRSKRGGDKLRLLNRPNKSLKSLLQESGAPMEDRYKMVVLSDEEGAFWAEGFGPDIRVLPDENTKKLLLIFKASY